MKRNERLHHIVNHLRARRSTTLGILLESTGASRATLMRDLAWLRSELGHPIHWDHDTGTYRWLPDPASQDAPRELPGLWFTPSEVLAMLTLQKLIREVQPGDVLHAHLHPIDRRLQQIWNTAGPRSPAKVLSQRVRIIALGKREVSPLCFETVGMALVARKQLHIQYQSRGSAKTTQRTVSPQRLVYYRSNWFLDAWCHLRGELRSFSLDNIHRPHVEDTPAIDIEEEALDLTLGSGYGIFSGRQIEWAKLRFTPERARWVAAEQWHPAQKGEWDTLGRWVLQIPYSDDRELVMDILRHMPEVEVLAPESLRERVLACLKEGLSRWGVS